MLCKRTDKNHWYTQRIGTAAFRTDKKMPWAAFGRKTDFKKYDIELDGNKIPDGEFELKLKMRGYIRVCSFKML